MKNCYFSKFFKSFGVLQLLVLIAAFIGVAVVIDNANVVVRDEVILANTTATLTYALYGVSAVAAVLGLFKLKSAKINVFDLNRVATFLGVGSALIYKAATGTMNVLEWVIFPACLALLLVGNIIRIFFSKPEEGTSSWKHYLSTLARGVNLVVVALVGVGLAVTVMLLGNAAQIIDHQYYWYVIIGIVALEFVLIPVFSKKANIIDALVIGVTVAFLVLSAYFKRRAFMLPAFALAVAVVARGSLLRVTDVKPAKCAVNKYYSNVFAKYDVIFPALIAFIVVKVLYLVAFDDANLTSYFTEFGIAEVPNISLIVFGCAVAFAALPLLASLFLGKKKGALMKVDCALLFTVLIAIFAVPSIVVGCLDFASLLANTTALLVVCLDAVVFILAVVLTAVRIAKYAHNAVAEEVAEEVAPVEEAPVAEAVAEEVAEEVTPVEETPAAEEVVEEVAPVEEAPAAEEVVEAAPVEEAPAAPKRIRRKFKSRMMLASDSAKKYYSEVKNYLEMYRAKGRYSATCETYRRKGVVAKVVLAGKSLKVYLAMDPAQLAGSKYFFQDCSAKKKFATVPVCIKVKSKRGLNHFKELVDMMMANLGHKVKKNYEPVDYAQQLVANGEVILGELGFDNDYIHDTMHVKNIPAALPENLVDYIPQAAGQQLEEEVEVATVYLDTLCNHFNEGEVINLETLKANKIVSRGNVLHVKARGTVDRKLTIYAEEFDDDALKMILCTNGTAVKVINK